MNYSQAKQYLYSFTNYEKLPGVCYAPPGYSLQPVEELLHQTGNPHLAARTVHIAGTKGKGSIAAMVAQVLTVSGYRTGLYTSPHLHTLRERIQVDGKLISRDEFAALVTELQPYLEAAMTTVANQNHQSQEEKTDQPLTFFEALTVLAFAYFSQKKVDFQVLEVGLGGKLDATNVAKPDVCVIAPISLDHIDVLGDSLEKIAQEKAGIIKPGSLVVSSPQTKEASRVISHTCRQQRATLVQVGKDISYHALSADLHQQSFAIESGKGTHRFTIPLLGDYQIENAATAIATLESLSSLGFDISAENIARGLAQVNWPGRFHILNYEPVMVVDGAHNVASMKRLVENIKAYFNYDRLFLIIGTSCDKNISGIVKELVPLSPRVIVTHASHPRAASPSVIAAEFTRQGNRPEIIDTVAGAFTLAISTASKKDLICATGSLFVVAEALDYIARYPVS